MSTFDKGRTPTAQGGSSASGTPGSQGPGSGAPAAQESGPQKLPYKSLIVVIPAHHSVTPQRIAERMPRGAQGEIDVIVACAGQPAVLTGIQTHLRNAQFLLAPIGTSAQDLRVLAFEQAAGDVVTLVSGTPTPGEQDATIGGRKPTPIPLPLSVVVPVHNGGAKLDDTLAAIAASNMPRESFELIVVDDSSTDDSPTIAARYADVIVRLDGGRRGAAYARNRGIELSRGDVVAFVDPDVRIGRDTVLTMLNSLADDPALAAIAASSDGKTSDGGLATRYWNLLQQYGAHRYGGFGGYFNASCGIVRRVALLDVGMYNEWLFREPNLEDVELGERLHRGGHRVFYSRDLTVSYLQTETFGSVLRRAWTRCVMLTRSLDYAKARALGRSNAIHSLSGVGAMMAMAAVVLTVVAVLKDSTAWTTAAIVAAALAIAFSLRLLAFFMQRRGVVFGLIALPLHLLTEVVSVVGLGWGWVLRNLIGDPAPDPTTQAFAEVGMQTWPPIPKKH